MDQLITDIHIAKDSVQLCLFQFSGRHYIGTSVGKATTYKPDIDRKIGDVIPFVIIDYKHIFDNCGSSVIYSNLDRFINRVVWLCYDD